MLTLDLVDATICIGDTLTIYSVEGSKRIARMPLDAQSMELINGAQWWVHQLRAYLRLNVAFDCRVTVTGNAETFTVGTWRAS